MKPLAAPPDRGKLMTAEQVAVMVFDDPGREAWVRRNVPHKRKLGHSTMRWYERDVWAWLDSLDEGA